MKRILLALMFLYAIGVQAQHFGFSREVSSYVPAGTNEVQLNNSRAFIGKNKVTGNLLVLSENQVAIVNETNGKVIGRIGGDPNFSIVQAKGITTDNSGNYYVANTGTNGIAKFDETGEFITNWGYAGSGNGEFDEPTAICTDNEGNVYVADANNNRIQKFDANGNYLAQWGTPGAGDGQFQYPSGITYWPSMNLIVVTDFYNNRIQYFNKTGTYYGQVTIPIGTGTGPVSVDVDVVNNRLLALAQGKIHQYNNNFSLLATWGPDGTNGTSFSGATESITVSSYASPGSFARVYAVEGYKLKSYQLGGAYNGTLDGSYGSDGIGLGVYNAPLGADYYGSDLYVVERGRYNTATELYDGAVIKGINDITYYSMKQAGDLVIGPNNDQYILDRTTITSPSDHIEAHHFTLNNVFIDKISFNITGATAMTLDHAGNFYFAVPVSGIYSIYKFGSTGNLKGSWSLFSKSNYVPSMAVDASNNLYVAVIDPNTNIEHILKYNSNVELQTTFGSHGLQNGLLFEPSSIDVDNAGNIYVLQKDRLQVFNSSFNFIQRVDLPGGVQPGQVNNPFLIRVNGAGTELAILDRNTDRVQYFETRTDQVINFTAISSKTFGDGWFPLNATGGASGNPVTFTSSDPNILLINGNSAGVGVPGTVTITAKQAGSFGFNPAMDVVQTVTVSKANQTISFDALPSKKVNDAAFALTATTTYGEPAIFLSSNLAVATIAGNTVTITGAGSTVITASQPGNANLNPAADVPQTLVVNKLDQFIMFNPLPVKTAGDAPITLAGVSNSALTITYSSSNTAVATITGNTLTITGGGTSIITAMQNGNALYNAAASVPQTLTVNKLNQTISFNALPVKKATDPAMTLTGTASSTLPINYISSNTAVATLNGNVLTIMGAGTTTITAKQNGSNSYNPASDVLQTLTVTKVDQHITFNTLPVKKAGDDALTLTGTTDSGLPLTYVSSNTDVAVISGNVLTIVSAGTSIITASQSGDNSYNAAVSVTQQLTVSVSDQTITFDALKIFYTGNAPVELNAVASSGLLISYSSSNTSVATVSGNSITIVGEGTTTITASQSGNASYHAAPEVLRELKVLARLNQNITFNPFETHHIGDADIALNATASSGLSLSYTSSNEAVAKINGTTLTITGEGTATITAKQSGNDLYLPATAVEQVITVTKTDQSISFGQLVSKTIGEAPFTLSATASSLLEVTYSTSDNEIKIEGTQVTLIKPGFVTIKANQNGNTIFNPADQVTQGFCINPLKPSITSRLNDTPAPVLTSSSPSGNQWYFNDQLIADATNATYEVTKPGKYTVVVKAETCSSEPANAYIGVITAVNQEEVIAINAYPNPATDFITFKVPVSGISSVAVTISNASGTEILRGEKELLNTPLFLGSFADGLYIARFVINGKTSQQKFIKK